jgi:RimJ/RimL family protein N-acetyltransferase
MPTAPGEALAASFVHRRWVLPDGTRLRLRTVQPADAPALGVLLGSLDPGARRRRFHGAVNVDSPSWPARMSAFDPACEWAAVVHCDGADDGPLVGELRLACPKGAVAPEFGMSVATAWQRRGIGRWALRELLDVAAASGWGAVRCRVLSDNLPMQGLLQSVGFEPDQDGEGPCQTVVLRVDRPGQPPRAAAAWPPEGCLHPAAAGPVPGRLRRFLPAWARP